jgi:nitrogen-specific signal transduction histidine kinase
VFFIIREFSRNVALTSKFSILGYLAQKNSARLADHTVLEALEQLSEASRTKNINYQRTYNQSGEKTTVRSAPYKNKTRGFTTVWRKTTTRG